MTIRPYESKDKENVRNVCLYCDGYEEFHEDTKLFLLSTYCDYYTEKEPHNCFVAANENDEAVGYILCAEDFDSFFKCFNEEYFSKIDEENKQHRYYASTAYVHHERYKELYPAHLHIDILEEYQRMGLGHQLMNTLLSHLAGKGIKGLMLTVATYNPKGMAFYKKYGFTLLEERPDCLIYGISFNKGE